MKSLLIKGKELKILDYRNGGRVTLLITREGEVEIEILGGNVGVVRKSGIPYVMQGSYVDTAMGVIF